MASTPIPSFALVADPSSSFDSQMYDYNPSDFEALFAEYKKGLEEFAISHPELDDQFKKCIAELTELGIPEEKYAEDPGYITLSKLRELRSRLWQSAQLNPATALKELSSQLLNFLKFRELDQTTSAEAHRANLKEIQEKNAQDPQADLEAKIEYLELAIVSAQELAVLRAKEKISQLETNLREAKDGVPILDQEMGATVIPDSIEALKAALDTEIRNVVIRAASFDDARKRDPKSIVAGRKEHQLKQAEIKRDFLRQLYQLETELLQAQRDAEQAEALLISDVERTNQSFAKPTSLDVPTGQVPVSDPVPCTTPPPVTTPAVALDPVQTPDPGFSGSPTLDGAVSQPDQSPQPSSSVSTAPSDRVVWLQSNQQANHNHEVPSTARVLQAKIASLDTMPRCVEKYLWLLYCRTALLDDGGVVGELEQFQRDTQALFEELQERLGTAVDRFILPNLDDVVRSVSQPLATRNWKAAKLSLIQICRRFTPFNLHEALFLIERSKNAGQLGGSIVLLTGPTGCGKSTTVHYLAGSSFVEINIDPNSLQEVEASNTKSLRHFKPLSVPGRVDLSSFVSSPEMRSETRYVNTMQLRCQVDGRKNIEFTLADTAGFGDTRGPELEMANTAGLVCALHAATNCRLLVLIKKDSLGSRLDGLVRLFDTLASMFKVIEDVLPSVVYVLTGFKKSGGLGRFLAKAENARKHLTESNRFNGSVALFFNDLLAKAENANNIDAAVQAEKYRRDDLGLMPMTEPEIALARRAFQNAAPFLLDPRVLDPAELLLKIDQTPLISRPDEMFQFFPAQIVDDALGKQLLAERTRIQQALQSEAPEAAKYVEFKLREMQSLAETVPMELIVTNLSNIKEDVKQCIANLSTNAVQRLENALKLEQMTAADLVEFRSVADRASYLAESLKSSLNEGFVLPPNTTRLLTNAGRAIAAEVRTFLLASQDGSGDCRTAAQSSAAVDSSSPAVVVATVLTREFQLLVNKLSVLAVEVGAELRSEFQPISTALEKYFDERKRQLEALLESNQIVAFAEELPRLSVLDLPEPLRTIAKTAQDKLIDSLKDQLYRIQQSVTHTFGGLAVDALRNASLENIKFASKSARLLSDLKSGYAFVLLRKFLGPIDEDLIKVGVTFGNALEVYLSTLVTAINHRLGSTQDAASLAAVKEAFLCLKYAYSEIALIDVSRHFQTAVLDLSNFFQKLREDVEAQISELLQEADAGRISPFAFLHQSDTPLDEQLILLREPSWVDSKLPDLIGGRQETLERLTRRLTVIAKRLEGQLGLSESQLSVRDHSQLPTMLAFTRKFVTVASLFPELEARKEDIVSKFANVIERALSSIADLIPTFRRTAIQDELQWLHEVKSRYEEAVSIQRESHAFLQSHNFNSISEILQQEATYTARQAELQAAKDQAVSDINAELTDLQAKIRQATLDDNSELQDELIELRGQKRRALTQITSSANADIQACEAELARLKQLNQEYAARASANPTDLLNRAAATRPALLENPTLACVESKIADLKEEEVRIQARMSASISSPALIHSSLTYLLALEPLKSQTFPVEFHLIGSRYYQVSNALTEYLKSYLTALTEKADLLFKTMTQSDAEIPVLAREQATEEFDRELRGLQRLEKGDLLSDQLQRIVDFNARFRWVSFLEWQSRVGSFALKLQRELQELIGKGPVPRKRAILETAGALSILDTLFGGSISPSFNSVYLEVAKQDQQGELEWITKAKEELAASNVAAALTRIDYEFTDANRALAKARLTNDIRRAGDAVFRGIEQVLQSELDTAELFRDLDHHLSTLKLLKVFKRLDEFYEPGQFEGKLQQAGEQLREKMTAMLDNVEDELKLNSTFERFESQRRMLATQVRRFKECADPDIDYCQARIDGLQRKLEEFGVQLLERILLEEPPEYFTSSRFEIEYGKAPNKPEILVAASDSLMQLLKQANKPSYCLIVKESWPQSKTVAAEYPQLKDRQAAYLIETSSSSGGLDNLSLFFFPDFYTKKATRIPPPRTLTDDERQRYQQALKDLVRTSAGGEYLPATDLHAPLTDNYAVSLHQRTSIADLRTAALAIALCRNVEQLLPEVHGQACKLAEQWASDRSRIADVLKRDLCLFQVHGQALPTEEVCQCIRALAASGNEQEVAKAINRDVVEHMRALFQEVRQLDLKQPFDLDRCFKLLEGLHPVWELLKARTSVFGSVAQTINILFHFVATDFSKLIAGIVELPDELDALSIKDACHRFGLFLTVFHFSIVPAALGLTVPKVQAVFNKARSMLDRYDKSCARVTAPITTDTMPLRSVKLNGFAESVLLQLQMRPLYDKLVDFRERAAAHPSEFVHRLRCEPNSSVEACFFQLGQWTSAEGHLRVLYGKLRSLPEEVEAALNTQANTRRNDDARTEHYAKVFGSLTVLHQAKECLVQLYAVPTFQRILEQDHVNLADEATRLTSKFVDTFAELVQKATELIPNPSPRKDELDEFNFKADELRLILHIPSPPKTNILRIDAQNLHYTSDAGVASLVSVLTGIKERLDASLLNSATNIKLLPDGPIRTDDELEAASKVFVRGMMASMKAADKFLAVRPQIVQNLNASLEQLQAKNPNGIRAVGIALRMENSPLSAAILGQFGQFKGEMIYRFNAKGSGTSATVNSTLSRMANDPRNTDFDVDKLGNRYKTFKLKYDELIRQHITERNHLLSKQQNIDNLLNIVADMKRRVPTAGPRNSAGLLTKVVKFFGRGSKPPAGAVPTPFASSSSSSSFSSSPSASSSFSASSSGFSSSSPSAAWSPETYQTFIPELVAGIFAVWTTSSAGFFESAAIGADRENYLLQPKPVQVLSIFRMLGVGVSRENSQLMNNIVEIKTGEGKSVTLAVTAVTLALLGYDISVSCYSEFLTQRDWRAFEELFSLFRVKNYIHYGTFSELCEDEINCNGDLRTQVHQMLFPHAELNSTLRDTPKNDRQRILLIDEVDVFFRKDFFGNEYTPAAKITSESVRKLVGHIWHARKVLGQFVSLDSVKLTPEYAACAAEFTTTMNIVDEAIKEMIGCLEDFANPKYVVQENRIGYMQDQGVNFNTFYGYKTMWAHFEAASMTSITPESRDANTALLVQCGRFSYAEIPKSFISIIGVTGTLASLSPIELEILKFYKIERKTFAPSMYPEGAGAQTREWLQESPNHLKIVFETPTDTPDTHREELFQVICTELKDYLNPSGDLPAGAALVFFENEEVQQQFSKYPPVVERFDQIRVFSEKDDNQLKDAWVREATTSGQLSLIPRSLGRGTDFSCEDPKVLRRGGVLVIQTFLSKEYSEEIQIRGRCGRQGQPGKYRLFLRSGTLEEVGVSKEMIEELKSDAARRYTLLHEARNKYFESEYGSVLGAVDEKRDPHRKATAFLQALPTTDKKPAIDFILSENTSTYAAKATGNAKTLVLIDGTGSMGLTLKAATVCVSTMFDLVKETLRQHGIDENFFQLMFGIYRNYNSRADRLLQVSGWESDSKNLSVFLSDVRAEGGSSWGEEAVEIALKHIVDQLSPELKQVLIIGDAPSQTLAQVQKLRQQCFGEAYWSKEVGPPTSWQDQLNIIKQKDPQLPIHAYWLTSWCQPFFEGLATQTGGKHSFLDTNSPKGAQVLRDTVAEAILATHKESAVLVATYRKNIAARVHV